MVCGKKIAFDQETKPMVKVNSGKTLVGQVSPSLAKTTLADGMVKTYKYALTEKLQPQLITGNRIIQWGQAN